MEYKLISNENVDKLNDLINDHLSNGWTLYGSPSCSISVMKEDKKSTKLSGILNKYDTIFCQSVTK